MKQLFIEERKKLLNTAKEYYENNKEVLKEIARKKYRGWSEEEKNIRREYGRNQYLNMSEGKKQKLKEYQNKYGTAKKSQFSDQ